MRALVVTPPNPGVELVEVPEPAAGPGEVKVRVLECGVCGTDRDIVAGKYGRAPAGSDRLILGHENFGRVESVGPGVVGWSAGELVVATVRRGCNECRFCWTNRSDFCLTGKFTERGIGGRDGYLAEAFVDLPEYLVHVPERLRPLAVLLEPLSVVEKAVEQGLAVLNRMEPTPGFHPESSPNALVAGTGAVGMLAAFLLRSKGFNVTGVDRHGETTLAASLLGQIGAAHVDATSGLDAVGPGRFDLVLEATGAAALDFDLIERLGRNGVGVLTGIPAAGGPAVAVAAGELWRDFVLSNQALVGSVNANRRHFERGLTDLGRFRRAWKGAIESLITARRPLAEFLDPLAGKEAGTIKTVLTVGS